MAKAQKLRSCASSDINKNKHIDQTILILFVTQGFPLIFAVTYQITSSTKLLYSGRSQITSLNGQPHGNSEERTKRPMPI